MKPSTVITAAVGMYLGVAGTLFVALARDEGRWTGLEQENLPAVAMLSLLWPVAAAREVYWWWFRDR